MQSERERGREKKKRIADQNPTRTVAMTHLLFEIHKYKFKRSGGLERPHIHVCTTMRQRRERELTTSYFNSDWVGLFEVLWDRLRSMSPDSKSVWCVCVCECVFICITSVYIHLGPLLASAL